VIPIGGRLGAAPAAAPEDFNEESTQIAQAPDFAALMASPAPVPTPVPAPISTPAPAVGPAPAPAIAPAALVAPVPSTYPTQRGPGIPTGAWIAIVGAGAFGVALAVMVAGKMFGSEPPPVAAADPAPSQAAPSEATQPSAPREADVDLQAAEAPNPGEATTPATPETPRPRVQRPRTTGPAGARKNGGNSARPTKQLSAEEQALLDRFGDSSSAAPGNLRVRGPINNAARSRGPLDAAQVRRVVTRNRPALQRCYDRAIRGRADPPSVRMDVALTVSSGGRVTRASASGNDFGGLRGCLETSVRRWRFPPSAQGGQSAFPVVFSSGN